MRTKNLFFLGFVVCSSILLNGSRLQAQGVQFQEGVDPAMASLDLQRGIVKAHPNLLLFYGEKKNPTQPGVEKALAWHLKNDFAGTLNPEGFDFAVQSEPEVKKKIKWPYYVAGGAVVGGIIVYLIMKDLGEEEEVPTTGSIIIEVPVEF